MNEIEQWLNSRIGLNFRSGLSRMERVLDAAGRPEQAYPAIHVTGTNGKGSTVAFMTNLFREQGLRVGSFTSPHMDTVRDRICIGGEPIGTADFVRLGGEVQELERFLPQDQGELSYFEILTLMALLYFREQEVDLALIEVGIGGLLDTTNVITGEIALITSVGLDHQETLGSSIKAIAEQKAGIFKARRKAVIGPLPPQALEVCRMRAESLSLDLYEYGQDFSLDRGCFSSQDFQLADLTIGLPGRCQEENAALALQAFWLFMARQGRPADVAAVRRALAETRWSGRLEEIRPGIYLDGAHNLPALKRLAEFVREQKGREVRILFGALRRKDYQAMLDYLQQELPEIPLTVTSFAGESSLGRLEAGELDYTADYCSYIRDFQAHQTADQLLLITGSLYFIAELRPYLLDCAGEHIN